MSVRPKGVPIIPDIAGLTTVVRAGVTGASRDVVEDAFAQLDSTYNPVTLENLLDYLRRLAAIPGTADVRGFSNSAVLTADAEICALVRDHLEVTLPGIDTAYHAIALWAQAAKRHAPMEVFTTNYDLLLEQALEAANVPYFDGFVGSHRPSFDIHAVEEDELPNRWVRLWKLHGSINWATSSGGDVLRCPTTDKSDRVLIYPSHLKYEQSRRLPYLALLDRLRGFLRRPSSVIVSCGFSYRDEHINEVIGQALRSNPTASVQALLFGQLEQYSEALALARRTPNLSLLAEDAAVVGTQTGDWATTSTVSTFPYGNFSALGDLLRELVGGASLSSLHTSAPTP
ncbi:SIR2-like protein [Blastococcus xanthinilyticus]|uniref:SIR2-like protein n=2 Tax=Blastococcus xanthinilyticus TaxID=1564164 RepID=A0A5S5CNN4_9ACTN|nr:SIR2-like protein [Blastococcus xanthinilyticus]